VQPAMFCSWGKGRVSHSTALSFHALRRGHQRAVEPGRATEQAGTMRREPSITPLTLGNMRSNSVRSLSVYCWTCHHDAVLNVDH